MQSAPTDRIRLERYLCRITVRLLARAFAVFQRSSIKPIRWIVGGAFNTRRHRSTQTTQRRPVTASVASKRKSAAENAATRSICLSADVPVYHQFTERAASSLLQFSVNDSFLEKLYQQNIL